MHKQYKHTRAAFLKKVRALPKRYYIIAALLLVGAWYGVLFGLKQAVIFSYAGDSCVPRLTVLPQLHSSPEDASFVLEPSGGVKGFVATRVCAAPLQHPKEGEHYATLSPFGGWLFRQQFTVEVPPVPVANVTPLTKPLSTTRDLALELSAPDTVFEYHMSIGEKTTPCETKHDTLLCDISPLKLGQGEEYRVELQRKFGDTSTILARKNVTTLPAVALKTSSVTDGQVLYDKPQEFMLELDKPLEKVNVELVQVGDEASEEIVTKTTIEDETVVRVTASEELPREKRFELRLLRAQAQDGSGLDGVVTVPFRTSGGPEPTGVSANGSDVQPGSTATITFDQEISQEQDIAKFIEVKGAAVELSRGANQVYVAPAQAEKCADITITIKKGFLSKHGIPRTKPWHHSFRTSCYTTSTIGYSANGRAITAYHFGNGGEAILFVGGIHGDERSASLILHDLIDDLNVRAHTIPEHRQVVVVPTLSPDGYATGSRNNANNVNLNRNFATSDWKKDLQDTNGSVPGGGGETPMSEPETQAIAALSRQLMPRFVLSYHAVGSVVIGNLAGDSSSRAAAYASQVGYRNGTGRDAEIFDYAISGTYDDWLMQKLGVPSMIVELGSYSYRNYAHHKPAMWQVIMK